MPPDLIVLTASNGENLKLAERFVQAAAAEKATAEEFTAKTSSSNSDFQGQA